MDLTDRSAFVVFGSVSVRFGPSSFLSRSGPTPSPKLSVLHIGPNRTETEPMLSIPDQLHQNSLPDSWFDPDPTLISYHLSPNKDFHYPFIMYWSSRYGNLNLVISFKL